MSVWAKGYTQAELDIVQEKFDLKFPPDLIELYLDRRPAQGYDWRSDDDSIRTAISNVTDGIVFDVEHNEFWLAQWGERPTGREDRTEIVEMAIAQAPDLIPLLGHRFLPSEPNAVGNPIFSIHQTDIIYYGANLEHYFENEFGSWSGRPLSEYKKIRFWSDIVE